MSRPISIVIFVYSITLGGQPHGGQGEIEQHLEENASARILARRDYRRFDTVSLSLAPRKSPRAPTACHVNISLIMIFT